MNVLNKIGRLLFYLLIGIPGGVAILIVSVLIIFLAGLVDVFIGAIFRPKGAELYSTKMAKILFE